MCVPYPMCVIGSNLSSANHTHKPLGDGAQSHWMKTCPRFTVPGPEREDGSFRTCSPPVNVAILFIPFPHEPGQHTGAEHYILHSP